MVKLSEITTLIENKFVESWKPLFIEKLHKLRCKV